MSEEYVSPYRINEAFLALLESLGMKTAGVLTGNIEFKANELPIVTVVYRIAPTEANLNNLLENFDVPKGYEIEAIQLHTEHEILLKQVSDD